MPVDFKDKTYIKYIEKWKFIDDICESENLQKYLRYLNEQDKSQENISRNKSYQETAVFYAVAGFTLQGLVGTAFRKVPVFEIPSQLDYLKDNCDGNGISIFQQSQTCLREILKKDRCALHVTYPDTENGEVQNDVTRADIEAQKYFATINRIDAEQVINVQLVSDGANVKLGLVVYEEWVSKQGADDFEQVYVYQLRELRLIKTEGSFVYVERKWQRDAVKKWAVVAEHFPKDSQGNTWDYIPFNFIGAVDNSHRVNTPPMQSICLVNKGHFQNSADFEDSVWYAGQNQPWMSGVTKSHIALMQENKMYAGSRNILGVPSGEKFGFAKPAENPIVRQAMLDKIDLMIGLGARFMSPGGAVKTATQAEGEKEVSHSVLSLSASNISEAYTEACKHVARFNGVNETEILYQLTQDFVSPTATAQDIKEMVNSWMMGAIPHGELLDWFKAVGRLDGEKTNEDIIAQIEASPEMPDLDAGNDR